MTTNQTIDGVPLLPCPFCGGEPYGTHDHYVHDDLSPMPCVECRACSAHLKAEDWNRRVQPGAQPQGEPVAYRYKEFKQAYENEKPWELATVALGLVYLERKSLAEKGELVGKEREHYMGLTIEPLYAEQPAPVATVHAIACRKFAGNATEVPACRSDCPCDRPAPVALVLPERREIGPNYPYLSDLDIEWNTCLYEVTRLNSKS